MLNAEVYVELLKMIKHPTELVLSVFTVTAYKVASN